VIFEDKTGVCPNCGFASAFASEGTARVWPTYFRHTPNSGTPPQTSMWVNIVVMRCLHCSKTISLKDTFAELPTESVDVVTRKHLSRRLIHPAPAPRELHESVPDAIRSFHREASTCEQAGALRGASVLYRAAVEELVNERGAAGRNLYERIEDLKSKGLSAELVDDLHEARLLGNDSIHDGLEYSAEEVGDVAELIEEATVLLYVQPAERQRMRDARKDRREQNV